MHSSKTSSEKPQQNPSKPFSSFLYKLIFVSIFIALLPFLPSSQNLEFSNNSFVARSYELLHLLLVGIAISYGLFSRRNSDPDVEKEIQLKTDTPQSYVSKILNVSYVFDDEEVESPKGFDFVDETKNQTWNYSQYYREKPAVMVAKESVDEANSRTKPVFLPVRSFKSSDSGYESYETWSSFTSNQKDEVGKNGQIGGKEGVVLPSPIPWRSRSGKMEIKEESTSPSYSPLNSASNKEMGPSRSQSFKSPSPKRLSPSPSLSQEIKGKFNEDSGRRKSFHKPSPPPPPPPPPPPLNYASHFISEKRDTRKNFKDELEDLSNRGRREFSSDSFNSEQVSYVERLVRTVRSKEAQGLPPLPRNQSEKRNEFTEKMIIHSDSESDDNSESSDVEEASKSTSTEADSQENEVDKKADEFIAKFREQIRLQRIASIKKSSEERPTRSSK